MHGRSEDQGESKRTVCHKKSNFTGERRSTIGAQYFGCDGVLKFV